MDHEAVVAIAEREAASVEIERAGDIEHIVAIAQVAGRVQGATGIDAHGVDAGVPGHVCRTAS